MAKQPMAKLNNGLEMPLFGLGTWKGKDAAMRTTVEAALRMGYRHIDTAQMYGNHEPIGEVFGKVFSEGGSIGRKDVWVTSKLANNNHAPERVAQSCRETLAELKLEYLDLFLMHWPVTGNKGPHVEPPIKETWKAMEKLVDEGLVRTIGISNFSVKKIKALLEYARIPPAVNQIEVHPYMRNDYNIKFCSSKGIHVTAYSPLGSPDSATMMKRSDDAPRLLHEAVVVDIAKQHNKAAAQVLVRWALQHGTSVIPKASSEDHLRSNLDALQWQLPEKEYSALSTIAYQARMVDGSMWLSEEGPYKTLDDLWDGELTGELKEE